MAGNGCADHVHQRRVGRTPAVLSDLHRAAGLRCEVIAVELRQRAGDYHAGEVLPGKPLLRFAVQDDRRRANGRTADAALLAGVALRTGLLDRRCALHVQLFKAAQAHQVRVEQLDLTVDGVELLGFRLIHRPAFINRFLRDVCHATRFRRARVFQILDLVAELFHEYILGIS